MKKPYNAPISQQIGDLSSRYPYSPAKSEYENAPDVFARPARDGMAEFCAGSETYFGGLSPRIELAPCPTCESAMFCADCQARFETVTREIDRNLRGPFDPEFMALTERRIKAEIAWHEAHDKTRLYFAVAFIAILTFTLSLTFSLYFRG